MGNLFFHDAENYFRIGITAMDEGRPQDALEAFRQSVQLDDTNPQVLVALGMAALMVGEFEEGLAAFQQVLAMYPDDLPALLGTGSALAVFGEMDEAISYLDRAEAVSSDEPEILATLAGTYMNIEEFERAQQVIDRGLKAAPKHPILLVLQGKLRFAQGFLDMAILPLREAIRQEPEMLEAHFVLGTVCLALERFQEADAEFTRTLEIDPQFFAAYTSKAITQYHLGHEKEAFEFIDRALAASGNDPNTRFLIGHFYWTIQRPQDALAQMKQAVELDSEFVPAYEAIIEIAQVVGDDAAYEQARAMLEELDAEYFEDEEELSEEEIVDNILFSLQPPPIGTGAAPEKPAAKAKAKKAAQKPATNDIYQLKITLKGFRPPIWRRIQVRGDITLEKLHRIIQASMGWIGGHLHDFHIGDMTYGVPDREDSFFGHHVHNEKSAYLSNVLPREKMKMKYTYDFGDSWEHEILLEKIVPPVEGQQYPVCIKGKGACPPEDIGGVWGYAEFLEAIHDPSHPQYEEYREWIGDDFDPEAFDIDAVNARLKRMK